MLNQNIAEAQKNANGFSITTQISFYTQEKNLEFCGAFYFQIKIDLKKCDHNESGIKLNVWYALLTLRDNEEQGIQIFSIRKVII